MGITETVAKTQINTLSAAFAQLSAKLMEVGNSIGEALKPLLVDLSEGIRGFIDSLSSIGAVLSPLVSMFGAFKSTLIPLIGILLSVIVTMKLLHRTMKEDTALIFAGSQGRSEEHTSELQSRLHIV